MQCPCPKRPKGRLAGTQITCVSANTAGPVVGKACDACARKVRRACWQERKRLASPQTPQGLLSGKHAKPMPQKTKGPVSLDENDLRLRKHRRACCWGSMRCPRPKSPKSLLAGTQMTCVSGKHRRASCWGSMQCPCPKSTKGLLAGTQTTCAPANTAGPAVVEACDARSLQTEGPVSRDANDLRPRKHCRACCWGSMRCPCPKTPKGLLAGTRTTCVPTNTAGPVVGEACDAHARKDRRAC